MILIRGPEPLKGGKQARAPALLSPRGVTLFRGRESLVRLESEEQGISCRVRHTSHL